MKFKLGISPLYDKELVFSHAEFSGGKLKLKKISLEGIAKEFKDLGISHLEFILDYKYFMDTEDYTAFLDEIRYIIKRYHMTLSFHLPIYSIELASWNEKIRRASVDAIVESINETLDLNPLLYVLHPTGPLAAEFTLPPSSSELSEFLAILFVKISSGSILEIIRKTGIDPKRIAIENDKFPFLAFKDMMDDIQTGVCLDTGHILAGISGRTTVDEMFDAFKEHIVEIHLHDGVLVKNERGVYPKYHLPLGVSGYDFMGFLQKLKQINFEGPVVFEMSLSDVKKSVNYIMRG